MRYVQLLFVQKLVEISNLRIGYVSKHNKNHNIEPKSKNVPTVNRQN